MTRCYCTTNLIRKVGNLLREEKYSNTHAVEIIDVEKYCTDKISPHTHKNRFFFMQNKIKQELYKIQCCYIPNLSEVSPF